jgi:hypothetical protein
MNATGSLFSQILGLFQRSDFARHVRELKPIFYSLRVIKGV